MIRACHSACSIPRPNSSLLPLTKPDSFKSRHVNNNWLPRHMPSTERLLTYMFPLHLRITQPVFSDNSFALGLQLVHMFSMWILHRAFLGEVGLASRESVPLGLSDTCLTTMRAGVRSRAMSLRWHRRWCTLIYWTTLNWVLPDYIRSSTKSGIGAEIIDMLTCLSTQLHMRPD